VLAEETTCWICGQPGTTADPLTADTSCPVPTVAGPSETTIAQHIAHATHDAEQQQQDEPHPNKSNPSNRSSHDGGGRDRLENRQARRPHARNPRRRLTHEDLAEDVTGYGPPTHKHCSSCGEWLPLEDFVANHRTHLGRSSWCRVCHRAATREWRDRNRERVNAERRAAYRAEHPRPEKRCVVCGETFVRKPDAIVCSAECRRVRQLGQRRERRKAAA
jgi:predicted nucleic acid-binding Zn ribbon protein